MLMLPIRQTSIPEPLSIPPIRHTHDTVATQILELLLRIQQPRLAGNHPTPVVTDDLH